MNEKPILFSGEMVRAILDGRKTQTRRMIESKTVFPSGAFWDHGGYEPIEIRPAVWTFRDKSAKSMATGEMGAPVWSCKYGTSGDRLWVKETHFVQPWAGEAARVRYRADNMIRVKANPPIFERAVSNIPKWKPSIFMRRHFSRINLEITAVRVERLQSITDADARAEGCCGVSSTQFGVPNFRYVWESINGAGSWAKNPWVWVIEFRRI